MLNQIQIRAFRNLEYGNPRDFLKEIRDFENNTDLSKIKESIRTLRTNSLKEVREMRDAALFCVGMSEILGLEILFSPTESQDFDFVATYSDGINRNYCPVQLKELVPDQLNTNATIQEIITKLSKYADLSNVAVALRLNRCGRFEPKKLSLPPKLRVGSFWVYGAIEENQNNWCIWGDFNEGNVDSGIGYSYPN